jgi:hypothetical protein
MIVPDVPVEESGMLQAIAREKRLAKVFLAEPTSPANLSASANHSFRPDTDAACRRAKAADTFKHWRAARC